MEQLMASHIMENKRIPRKIKKALKYTFLYPRVCGRCLRYGAVYTVGRNSKWTRKAAKIRRYMDYAEMINMMTEQLKGIYANSPRKSYENLDSSFFEWEVETAAEEGRSYITWSYAVDEIYSLLTKELTQRGFRVECFEKHYPSCISIHW